MAEGLSKIKIWENEYLVSFYEVDMKSKIFLPSLWKFMQETAWNHANRIGIGYSDLARNNYIWVLSRLCIKMDEYPRWGDKIRVQTWLLGSSRLLALRDLSVTHEDGRIIGGAKSAWLVLDLKSRKPQRVEPLLAGIDPFPDRHGVEATLEKIPAPKDSEAKAIFRVHYSDLDMNQHVNNAKYIEWILDSYPLEMNQTHNVTTFEINFLAETNYGEELCIHSEPQKDSAPTFLHTMIRKEDGRELCRARVRWKRVE
jgi:acyl-ACP thioesterase